MYVFDLCDCVPRSRDVFLERRFAAICVLPTCDAVDAVEEFDIRTANLTHLRKEQAQYILRMTTIIPQKNKFTTVLSVTLNPYPHSRP